MRRLSFFVAVFNMLAVTATVDAFAADTSFNAIIDAKLNQPAWPCPDGAFRCGDSFVDGYGPAEWRFYVTGISVISETCMEYTARVTFTLDDGSTLTLIEEGTVCGPGKSFFVTPLSSWGNPDQASASWEIVDGSGQFEGLSGRGTDTIQSAGARIRGSYKGIVQ